MSTVNIAYGTWVSMTTTNLMNLANDSTDVFAGWQSDLVSNLSLLADDFEIGINIGMNAATPANDQAGYVYVVPWIQHSPNAFIPCANFGTTTRPTGAEGLANISDPNSMKGPFPLPYKVASQPLDGYFLLSQFFGRAIPDAWSLAIRNCTGGIFSIGSPSECRISYRPINWTIT